jgi:hypothetical protein
VQPTCGRLGVPLREGGAWMPSLVATVRHTSCPVIEGDVQVEVAMHSANRATEITLRTARLHGASSPSQIRQGRPIQPSRQRSAVCGPTETFVRGTSSRACRGGLKQEA